MLIDYLKNKIEVEFHALTNNLITVKDILLNDIFPISKDYVRAIITYISVYR
jgi:hypothetical protein